MPCKRKPRHSPPYPRKRRPSISPSSRLAPDETTTNQAKLATTTTPPSLRPSPKPPSISPMEESTTLQAPPANSPPLPPDEEAARVPPCSPSSWVWRCQNCFITYRIGCTQRCLECSHKLCSANKNGYITDYTGVRIGHTSTHKRSCQTIFDYFAWEAWGSWRRHNDSDGGNTFETCQPTYVTGGEGRGGTRVVWTKKNPEQLRAVEWRKVEMYVRGEHDCSRHCDYPKQCHDGVDTAARVREQQELEAIGYWISDSDEELDEDARFYTGAAEAVDGDSSQESVEDNAEIGSEGTDPEQVHDKDLAGLYNPSGDEAKDNFSTTVTGLDPDSDAPRVSLPDAGGGEGAVSDVHGNDTVAMTTTGTTSTPLPASDDVSGPVDHNQEDVESEERMWWEIPLDED